MHVNWVETTTQLPRDYAYADRGPPEDLPTYLGPHANLWSAPMIIGVDRIVSLHQRRTHLFFYGWITYQDTFKNDHLTRFCQEAEIMGSDPRAAAGQMEWAFRSFGPFNCMDEDCPRQ